MKLAFTNMQGAGNDFVMFDGISQGLALNPSGVCAAVAAGIRRGMLDARVRVSMRGGDLTIRWEGGDNPVWMTGPAVTVFEGVMEIDES